MLILPQKWQDFLPPQESRLEALSCFLEEEQKASHTVYPPPNQIFRALELPPEDVRVVLIGQDPYHGEGQANGLAFSVSPDSPLPPSLRNMFKEIRSDIGGKERTDGDLGDWEEAGVLLLNRVLTVRAGQAGSHRGKGWEEITNDIVDQLSRQRSGLVFLLFGKEAQGFVPLLDKEKHTIITAPHPSPLSAYRGFFGSKVWSKANNALGETIPWAGK